MFGAYRRDVDAAEERLRNPGVDVRRVPVPWRSLEYARYGQGTPVLVVHGSGGGWDQGVDWARRRLDGSHDVIAVARAGYLGSDVPPHATIDVQADAYALLLDALGLERVDVVALSAGSVTVVPFAARHPGRVRRLVLESPVLPTRRPPRLPPVPVVRALTRAQPLLWALTRSPLLVGLSAGVRWRDLPADQRAELGQVNATLLPLAPRAPGTVLDAVAGREMIAGRVAFDGLRAPTLVVNAEHAMLAPRPDAEAFVARLPDARLLSVSSGGHVLVGNVPLLRAALRDFLGDAGP